MAVVIPEEVLQAANITEEDLRKEIALMLFEQQRLSLGQAIDLSGLDRLSFQRLLAERNVPLHYDVEEFEADLKTLRELGHISQESGRA